MIYYKKILPLILIILFLNACNGKLPGADARKIPYNPDERVKRNLEQGKGFRIDDAWNKEEDLELLSMQPPMNGGEHL